MISRLVKKWTIKKCSYQYGPNMWHIVAGWCPYELTCGNHAEIISFHSTVQSWVVQFETWALRFLDLSCPVLCTVICHGWVVASCCLTPYWFSSTFATSGFRTLEVWRLAGDTCEAGSSWYPETRPWPCCYMLCHSAVMWEYGVLMSTAIQSSFYRTRWNFHGCLSN